MLKFATVMWVGALAVKAVLSGVFLWSYAERHGGTHMLIDGIRSAPGLLAALVPTPGGDWG